MSSQQGKLWIVGTPIGNMEDITLRALRVLREVDLIAAEDTRHTALLLSRHNIRKPLVSYHEFNEAKRTDELMGRLREGKRIAVVSDAGMPTLSDPGMRLIKAVLQAAATPPHLRPLPQKSGERRFPSPLEGEGQGEGLPQIALEIIPGPSAITAALASSGLPGAPFLFYGFLPHKSTQRRKALTTIAPLPYTLVFFESPYRLVKSLADIREIFGNRHAVIARELTKKFEEVLRGDLDSLLKRLENRVVKGEITVLVEGYSE